MKLTLTQKEAICVVYERAMTLQEKYANKESLLIAFNIDHYKTFEITAHKDNGRLGLSRLAGDRVDVFAVDRCFQAISEIEEYCDIFLNNKEEAKQARIKQLEEEIARLKED